VNVSAPHDEQAIIALSGIYTYLEVSTGREGSGWSRATCQLHNDMNVWFKLNYQQNPWWPYHNEHDHARQI